MAKNNQTKFKETELGRIPEDWEVLRFGDISKFKYGKMPDRSKIVENGYPIYSGYRIVGNYSECMLKKPELIIVARGVGGTGDVKISPSQCWVTNLSIIADLDGDIADKHFLKYYFHNGLKQLDSGSAQSQITINDLNNVGLALPSLSEQRKIVGVLGVLDEKIELNRKMNTNLEQVGLEAVRREVSRESGLCPISNIAGVKSGYAFKSQRFSDQGEYGVIKIKNVTDSGVEVNDIQYCDQDPKAVRFELSGCDILIAMSGNTTGKIGLMPKTRAKMYLNQRVGKYFLKDHAYNGYLFFYLKQPEIQESIVSTAYGSAQPNINPGFLESIEIPNTKNINMLKLTSSLIDKIVLNYSEIETLSQIRDSLLPRLMSGKLRAK